MMRITCHKQMMDDLKRVLDFQQKTATSNFKKHESLESDDRNSLYVFVIRDRRNHSFPQPKDVKFDFRPAISSGKKIN